MSAEYYPEKKVTTEEHVRPGFAIPGPVWPGWPRVPWLLPNPPKPTERSPEPPWSFVDML